MKAIVINSFGGREKLVFTTVPDPVPAAGEILIRERAAGVNPVDWKIRAGFLKDRLPHKFPLILGWDTAGEIAAVGRGVESFAVGDDVIAYCRKPVVQGGTYAEYVVVPEGFAARKPKGLGYEESAAIPLAGLTAYQSLFKAGRLKSGETVLIHAAAGGVGGFAVQLAAHAGATVIGTASGRNHQYVRNLGAKAVIDYTKIDFRQAVLRLFPDGVDLVFDCVGGEVTSNSVEVLKPGGRIVTIIAGSVLEELQRLGRDVRYVFVEPNGQELTQLSEFADAGILRVELSGVLQLEQAAKAHELIETGHTCGKIVLTI